MLEIMDLAKNLNIILISIHLQREDPTIQVADAGSRVRDSDDWSLDEKSFLSLESQFGSFSIDFFADSLNATA